MNNPQKQLYQIEEVETSTGSALQTPNFAALSRDSTRTMYSTPVYTMSSSTPHSIMQVQTLPNFPGSPQRGPVTYTFQPIPGITYDSSPVKSSIPVSYITPTVTVPFSVQCSCPKPVEPMDVDEQRDDKELLDISTSIGNLGLHQNIVCGFCTQTSVDVCTSTDDLWAQSPGNKTSSPSPSRSSLPVIQEEASMDCATSTTDLPPSDKDDDDDDDSPEPLYLKTEASTASINSRSCISQCQSKNAKNTTKQISTSDMPKLPETQDSEETKDNHSSAKRHVPRGTVTLGTSTTSLEGNSISSSPSSETVNEPLKDKNAGLARGIVSSVVRRGFPSSVTTATSMTPSENSLSSNLGSETVNEPQPDEGESSALARNVISSVVRRGLPSTPTIATSPLEKPISSKPSSDTAKKPQLPNEESDALARSILSSAVRNGFPSTPTVATRSLSGKSTSRKSSNEAITKPQPYENETAVLPKDIATSAKNESIPRHTVTTATSTSSLAISYPSSETVIKSESDKENTGEDK